MRGLTKAVALLLPAIVLGLVIPGEELQRKREDTNVQHRMLTSSIDFTHLNAS